MLRSLVLAVSLAAACAASAQMLILPGARPPADLPIVGAPESPAPPTPRSASGPRILDVARDAEKPRTPRPVAAKTVSEESVLHRDLKLNGASGSLRLERAGRSKEILARVTLQGTAVAKPAEACTVAVEGGAAIALTGQGKPDGVPRYEVQAQSCPISFDILDGSVWIRGPEDGCVDAAATCKADPRGLWGPEPGALLTQARAIEQARGQADKAVRDNYRTITQRAAPGEVRAIVTEQAAFSSEREEVCRDYAREATHGFCHARFTEARAALLAAKLGTTGSIALSSEAPPKKRRAAPRRRAAPSPMPDEPSFGFEPNGLW